MELWTGTAMVILLAHFSGGAWISLFLLVAGIFVLGTRMPENTQQLLEKKWFCVLQLAGFYLLISQCLPLSAQYWPGEKAELVVPGVLLALGIYGCGKRPERVAGVLLWAILLLGVPILLAGIKDVRLEWIIPAKMEMSLWAIPAVLLPFAVEMAMSARQSTKRGLIGGVIGVGIWVLVAGILSFPIAQSADTPFRMMAQNLSIGPNSRFESVVSAAMTLGWYCVVTLVLTCANRYWKGLGVKENKSRLLHALILYALLLTNVTIAAPFIVAYIVVAWLIVPFIVLRKSSKK